MLVVSKTTCAKAKVKLTTLMVVIIMAYGHKMQPMDKVNLPGQMAKYMKACGNNI